jgi:hypothetical protein
MICQIIDEHKKLTLMSNWIVLKKFEEYQGLQDIYKVCVLQGNTNLIQKKIKKSTQSIEKWSTLAALQEYNYYACYITNTH